MPGLQRHAAVRRSSDRAAPLLVLAVWFGVAVVVTRVSIGHRHVLPVYPVLFIFAGGAGYWLARRAWAVMVLVLAMAGWMAVESAVIWPHDLAYFNQLVGGPKRGYLYLVDSSLDWGQDLPALKRYLDEHVADEENVYLSYFGTARPSYYGIEAQRLPGFMEWEGSKSPVPRTLQPGVYGISATDLQGVYLAVAGGWTQAHESEFRQFAQRFEDDAEWAAASPGDRDRFEQWLFARLCTYLRRRESDGWAGYSILIFRLSERELAQAFSQEL